MGHLRKVSYGLINTQMCPCVCVTFHKLNKQTKSWTRKPSKGTGLVFHKPNKPRATRELGSHEALGSRRALSRQAQGDTISALTKNSEVRPKRGRTTSKGGVFQGSLPAREGFSRVHCQQGRGFLGFIASKGWFFEGKEGHRLKVGWLGFIRVNSISGWLVLFFFSPRVKIGAPKEKTLEKLEGLVFFAGSLVPKEGLRTVGWLGFIRVIQFLGVSANLSHQPASVGSLEWVCAVL